MADGAAQDQESETRTLYVEIPADLHKRIRDRAYEERRSVAALVRDVVENYLDAKASA